MGSYWTGAYQRALVSNLLLLQRAYMENTDQEIKLLDKPSTQLTQLVENIKDISTAVSILPSTSWPESSLPLPLAAPSIITSFSTSHGQSGNEARHSTCSNYPFHATSLDFKSHSVTCIASPQLIIAF